MNKIENISKIILDGVNEGKSYEEINAALAEAGSSLVLGKDKPGNAYGGRTYQVDDDGKTLIEVEE